MKGLREKGDKLTAYFEKQIGEELKRSSSGGHSGIASEARCCACALKISARFNGKMRKRGIFVDFASPILFAPLQFLYNSFEDIYRLVQTLQRGSS